MSRPSASVSAEERSPASLSNGERAERITITLISSAIAYSALRTTSSVTGCGGVMGSVRLFQNKVAEVIAVAALAGVDDRRRPVVLDERGAGDRPGRTERLARVAWHRRFSRLPEVRALLAGRL